MSEREAAEAFARGRKDALEHCARCGTLLPFTPPSSVPFGTRIYCGTECRDLASQELAEIELCPACGERDPNAEHDDYDDEVHVRYREIADELDREESVVDEDGRFVYLDEDGKVIAEG